MLKRTVRSDLLKPIPHLFLLAPWYLHSRLSQAPHLETWVSADLERMDSLLVRLQMVPFRIRFLQMLLRGISQTALGSML